MANKNDLLEHIDIPGDSPRDRFSEDLKPAFNDADGTEWDNFFDTIAAEFDDFHDACEEVLLSSFPDTATGKELDRLGKLVQTPRRTGESDSLYRIRIKVQLRKRVGGGTIDDIKSASSLLLETEPTQIELNEDFATQSAAFSLIIDGPVIDNAGVTVDEFLDTIREIKAAGVEVTATRRGSFEFISKADADAGLHDANKGWSGVNYTGPAGTWSGLLGEV